MNGMGGQKEEKSFGATIAIIIIILVIVVGGYYIWQGQGVPQNGASDDLGAVEASLNQIDVGSIDADLADLEKNL